MVKNLVSVFISLVYVTGFSQNMLTQNTLALPSDSSAILVPADSLAFLSGHWVTDALGGKTDEFWLPPAGNQLTGLFRLVSNGKVVFTEHMTIGEFSGRTEMRIKHVNPDGSTWENQKETTRFFLLKMDGGKLYFSGLTIDYSVPGYLTYFLAIRKKDGSYGEEIFKYRKTDF